MNTTTLLQVPRSVHALFKPWTRRLEQWITPLFDLAARLYLTQVFWRSGWLKLQDWDATRYLFREEYHVPVLPPDIAAVMGAGGELLLPVLLVLGLAGRFSAAGLFMVNLVAAISFPDISDLGLQDHVLWGALLLMLVFHGPGRLSIDHWLDAD
ncbi:MAG: DoxX family protein [Burkholderiaceae bacterium]|nr:DoxX family protein [Roseateles sp.]MBV8469014.1 DoxX family protein [Burkholderiaceae bacterium]